MKPEQLSHLVTLASAVHTPSADELAGRFIDAFELARTNQNYIWPQHQYAIVLRLLQNLGVLLSEPTIQNVPHLVNAVQALNALHENTQPKQRTYEDKTGVPSESVRPMAESLAPVYTSDNVKS
jgi:hypothetical protein